MNVGLNLLLVSAVALGVSLILTPLVRALSIRWGVIDGPDGHRKLQAGAIPLGGGVSLFISMWAALGLLMVFSPTTRERLAEEAPSIIALLFASLAVAIVGLADDRFGLRGRHKLLGQCAAAAILVSCGLVIRHVEMFGIRVDLGLLSYPCTMLWLVGAMNALNLIDGIDGVATIVGIILSSTIAAMAVLNGHFANALVMIALAGSLIGFLRYNFPPASMYLGDAGSMLIGLVVGALAIEASLKGPATVAFAAPLAALTIPFLDTFAAILRRKLTGRSIYTTDRGHLHHLMVARSGSPRRALTWIGIACAVTGAGTLVSVGMKHDAFAIITSAAVVAILAFTRVFGHVELLLVVKKFRNLVVSFLSLRNRGQVAVRQDTVRLQGTGPWDLLWHTLLDSIDKPHLATIQLDVNVPAVHESYHALWRGTSRRDAQELWRVELPLYAGNHTLGRLLVTGEDDHCSACDVVHRLIETLRPFEARVLELAAQRPVDSLPSDVRPARLPAREPVGSL